MGGPTPFLPFEPVDAVLEETRAAQRRLRDLPSPVGVHFLVAMRLIPEVGCRGAACCAAAIGGSGSHSDVDGGGQAGCRRDRCDSCRAHCVAGEAEGCDRGNGERRGAGRVAVPVTPGWTGR
ncbi:transposase domain-containing protein [Streptomyces sp. NPDC002133]|uniref:transposase domain-containing protein n=1 Tax=Streptomyces sp. NPDC002133 TaxID=3154409 RepID=UPI0033306524